MIYPKRQEFIALAKQANVIPVAKEVYSDTKTPIGIFMRYADEPDSFLLESVEGGEKWGRYSFIGRNPYMTFSCSGDAVTIRKNGEEQTTTGNPFDILKAIFVKFECARIDGLPRFSAAQLDILAMMPCVISSSCRLRRRTTWVCPTAI